MSITTTNNLQHTRQLSPPQEILQHDTILGEQAASGTPPVPDLLQRASDWFSKLSPLQKACVVGSVVIAGGVVIAATVATKGILLIGIIMIGMGAFSSWTFAALNKLFD